MTIPVKQSRQLAQQYVLHTWRYCWQVRLSYTVCMNVLLRFYLWFNIYFPLLQAHYYTNYWKSKIKPRIKLNHNTYLAFQFTSSYWFCRGDMVHITCAVTKFCSNPLQQSLVASMSDMGSCHWADLLPEFLQQKWYLKSKSVCPVGMGRLEKIFNLDFTLWTQTLLESRNHHQ